MEISIIQSKIMKSIAILMMLWLHLFNRPYEGIFTPLLFIGTQPVSYYLSLFSDACVPIFLFLSGYGLYISYLKDKNCIIKNNGRRLFKLYINYWLIVLVFAGIFGFLIGKEGYPGNFTKFALNILGLWNSYNGAWWFFFTYILLTLSAPFLFKVLEFCQTWLFLLFVFLIYFVSFYFNVYSNSLFSNPYLAWLFRQFYLFGTSLLPFIFGALVVNNRWYSQLSNRFGFLKSKNLIAVLGIIMLILIHGFIPNLIIAPFLAVPFIFLCNQLGLGKYLEIFLLWLSEHTTNIWLIHMFFYSIFFEGFIYSPKYPILIFTNLLICSVIASFFINIIYKTILKQFNY
jgi:hypothetical protein